MLSRYAHMILVSGLALFASATLVSADRDAVYDRVDADNVPVRPFPETVAPRHYAASHGEKKTDDGDSLLSEDDKKDDGDSLLSEDDEKDDGDSLLSEDDKKDDGDSLLSEDDKKDDGDSLLSEDDKKDDGDSLLSEDDKKGDDGSLLKEAADEKASDGPPAAELHRAVFEDAGSRYPSANACATCHPRQYEQWSVSQHAYAQLSPIYMAFQMAVNAKTAGTNGDFCIRCHNQVGMNLGESVYTSNLDRHPTSREGITCTVCHRVNRDYGKISGRLPLNEGDLLSPVYGPTGDKELKRILTLPQKYRVVTERDKPGRAIHTEAEQFFQLTKPGFCGSCHDVTLLNGFRLEEAFAEFQQSKAAGDKVSCQDCHMGKVQGVAAGYETAPAAVVGDVPTRPRKVTNHFFAGPDYSVIHPGLFPHNVEAANFKSLREWLQFDHEAGWGTDVFEDKVDLDHSFPESWISADDRYDARKILDEQFRRLDWAKQQRLEVLRNAFEIKPIRVTQATSDGLRFEVDVHNITSGHAIPTGFDAERLMFLEIEVRDAGGKLVYASGDRDPNGDVRDSHSLYVHNGEAPLDEDLFSLQSRFVVRLNRGGEREEVLALNHSISPQPFIRPEVRATSLYGRPRGARKHKMGIMPLSHKTATYAVDGAALTGPGPYTIQARFVSQMVPVNLLADIQSVGFDFGMTPKEIGDRVVAGADLVAEQQISVTIK